MQGQTDQTKRTGKWFFFVAWLAALGLLYLFFGEQLAQQANPNQQVQGAYVDGAREIALQRNRAGHYVASGLINQQPVTFLLDTGATAVSVPAHLAEQLGLRAGAALRVNTANGVATAYRTTINELRIGNIVLRDVDANITPGMEISEILLGMSALKQVEFSQRGATLKIRQSS